VIIFVVEELELTPQAVHGMERQVHSVNTQLSMISAAAAMTMERFTVMSRQILTHQAISKVQTMHAAMLHQTVSMRQLLGTLLVILLALHMVQLFLKEHIVKIMNGSVAMLSITCAKQWSLQVAGGTLQEEIILQLLQVTAVGAVGMTMMNITRHASTWTHQQMQQVMLRVLQ
jgi:hypothetical protein